MSKTNRKTYHLNNEASHPSPDYRDMEKRVKSSDDKLRKTIINNRIEYGKNASHITHSSKDLYNQVSYNVLENAVKDEIPASTNSEYKAILSSQEVLGSKGGASAGFGSKSTIFAKKSANKPKSKTAIVIFIGVIIFLLLGCVVYSNLFGKLNDNKSAVKIVCNEVASIDRDLIQLNNILADEINPETIQRVEKIKKTLEDDKDKLSGLQHRIEYIAADSEAGSDDSTYAPLAKDAINSRLEMIDSGIKIIELAIPASEEIEKFDKFWTEAQSANDCLVEADDILNENDSSLVSSALSKSEEAYSHLETATEAINSVKSEAVSTEQYKNYLQIAKQVANYSIQTCSAMNEDNVEAATQANEKYLETKSQLADIANGLERNPAQVIRASYNIETQQYVDSYKQARNTAASVDKNIRDYLSK